MQSETGNVFAAQADRLAASFRQAAGLAAAFSGDDPFDGSEFMKLVLQQLGEGLAIYHQCDPAHPELLQYNHHPRGNFGNNPDTLYLFTRVDSRHDYRLWGRRNSVAYVDVQFGAMGTQGNNGAVLGHVDLDELRLGADGSFEVMLARRRPAGWAGDWRELPDGTELLYIRQVMLDWSAERDAELHIECVGAAEPPPPPRPDDVDDRTDRAIGYLANFVDMYSRHYAPTGHLGRLPVNSIVSTPFADEAGLRTQLYDWCWWEVEPGKALVVEAVVPDRVRYWSAQLNSPMLVAVEYPYRQSSLNAHQTHVDLDGRARFVVCAEDPGAPNWLDTAGLRRGVLMLRWDSFSSHETPSVTRVPVGEVGRHLPAGTPTVSPGQRRELLAARRRAMLARLQR